MTAGIVLAVGLGTVVINLGILGLTLKLYTEYFKDRSIAGRKTGEKP